MRLDLRFVFAVALFAVVCVKLSGFAGGHEVFTVVHLDVAGGGSASPASLSRALLAGVSLSEDNADSCTPQNTACPCELQRKFKCEEIGCDEKKAGERGGCAG